MKKSNKFYKEDILYHTKKDILLFVDDVNFIYDKGYLYTLKVLKPTHGEWLDAEKEEITDFKRYYEPKIENTCKLVARKKTINKLFFEGKNE